MCKYPDILSFVLILFENKLGRWILCYRVTVDNTRRIQDRPEDEDALL